DLTADLLAAGDGVVVVHRVEVGDVELEIAVPVVDLEAARAVAEADGVGTVGGAEGVVLAVAGGEREIFEVAAVAQAVGRHEPDQRAGDAVPGLVAGAEESADPGSVVPPGEDVTLLPVRPPAGLVGTVVNLRIANGGQIERRHGN